MSRSTPDIARSESAAASTSGRIALSESLIPSSSSVFTRMVSDTSLGTVVTRLLANRNGSDPIEVLRPVAPVSEPAWMILYVPVTSLTLIRFTAMMLLAPILAAPATS